MNRAILGAIAACSALLSDDSPAASRARYGGNLRVAIAARPADAEPSLADAPWDAALLSLTARGICVLDDGRRMHPVLASEISWQGAIKLQLALRPGLRFDDGGVLAAEDVLASWSRLSQPSSMSPYRALLFAARPEGPRVVSAGGSQLLEIPLAFNWPDLAASLCHPALAIKPATQSRRAGIGPFRPSSNPGELEANLGFPLGRPFVDRLTVAFTDERGAARRLALRQAQVVIGTAGQRASAESSRPLYATYLAFRAERAGADFRQAFEAAIDRVDLTRFFVPAPSVPMHALLPPSLMPQGDVQRPTVPAHAAGRALTLRFDQSLPEQRLVAERIQVKLHDLKYAVALKPVSRAQLRAAWASGDFDLMLHSVLLPPFAGPALALAIELSGRRDLLPTELPAIGALADAGERERAALERARALLPSLPIIPLYSQAIGFQVSSEVVSLGLDGYGLPVLDDAILLPQ